MNRKIIYYIGALIILLLFFSCTRQKRMVYLQNCNQVDSVLTFQNEHSLYRVQPGDVLYIKVLSINKDINDLFNVNGSENVNYSYNSDANLYIHGYSVNDSGFVSLPIVGAINVLQLTVEEARDHVQKQINTFLKDATVVLKLVSFKFTVLGEVERPGVYYQYNNYLTIMEAIGKAGDLTDYGDRRNVLVVRPTKNGTQTFTVNLLKNNLLNNEHFYLHPNDVVYVAPVKTKAWKMNASNISIVLSSITTLIVVLNFIY